MKSLLLLWVIKTGPIIIAAMATLATKICPFRRKFSRRSQGASFATVFGLIFFKTQVASTARLTSSSTSAFAPSLRSSFPFPHSSRPTFPSLSTLWCCHGSSTLSPRRKCSKKSFSSSTHLMMSNENQYGIKNDPFLPKSWSDLSSPRYESNFHKHLFPPLSPSSHKGSHGRIAILGGSEKYTGAPYYAATSALSTGVDLATVLCAREASVPIKCYSPELMVQSVYSIEEMENLTRREAIVKEKLDVLKSSKNGGVGSFELPPPIDKSDSETIQKRIQMAKSQQFTSLSENLEQIHVLEQELKKIREDQQVAIEHSVRLIKASLSSCHVLCVGPGLGRLPFVFEIVAAVVQTAMRKYDLTIVLDADALFMLSLDKYRELYFELRGYEKCIMTPNVMELKRLKDAHHKNGDILGIGEQQGHPPLRNIIVQKGHTDIISSSTSFTMECCEEGGLKRSGGIGDVLSGAITAFMAWNVVLSKDAKNDSISVEATKRFGLEQRVFMCWTACCAVKKATKTAFDKKRRSMSAVIVLDEIGDVVAEMEEFAMDCSDS